MDKWQILEIHKTRDKEIIKNAYRNKLVSVNPEDDSEGFMILRKAYEDALQEAEAVDDKTAESNTDGEESAKKALLNELNALYGDFDRRINPEEWKHIFVRDEFVSLDTAEASMNLFLSFLMEHSFVPHKVYELIRDVFDIKERKSELSENYPENFIEHILNNAMYKDNIDYELFETREGDIDEFIRLYYRLDNAIQIKDVEEEGILLDAIEKFGISHPYVEISKLRHELHRLSEGESRQSERAEKYSEELYSMQKKAEKILAKYKDDILSMLVCGDIALVREEYSEAGKYYEMAYGIEPEDYVVKGRMGTFYYATGEYVKSRDIFLELLDIDSYDQGARAGMVRANNGLIESLKKEIAEQPDNDKLKLEIAWCYYLNDLSKEAIEVLEAFCPSDDDKCRYYNLLGRNYLDTNQYEKAQKCFFEWKAVIEAVPEQERSEKEKNQYQYVNYFIADSYIRTENYDEARKYLEAAMSREHELMQYACEAMCRLEYECGNYEACIHACERLLERYDSYQGYMYMAKGFDWLGQYSQAINACEHAVKVYPYDSEPYVLEAEIYWEFELYDDVKRVLDRFRQLGCDSAQMDYYRAGLLALEERYADSNEVLRELLDKKGTESTDIKDYLDVYIQLGSNYEKMDEDSQALHCFDEAFRDYPDNLYLLYRIAGVCHVIGDFKRACGCYDRILELTEDERYREQAYIGKAAALSCLNDYEAAKKTFESCEAEFGLDHNYVIDHAELLVRMNDLAGCVKLMETCIHQLEYGPLVQSCIGNLCCFYGNEGLLDEAYRMFELAINKKEKDYQAYRSMGCIYLEHGMYEKAKEMFLKGFELDEEKRSFICEPYLVAVSRTDDIKRPEYQKYIEIAEEQLADAGDSYTYNKKAEFYRSIRKYDEALRLAEMAIHDKRKKFSFFIESHEAWFEKGNIYEEMKEYKKALECYQRALQIFGHHALYEEYIKHLSYTY